jgi:archaeosine-15-forming tRNA-guanine transglycosylase
MRTKQIIYGLKNTQKIRVIIDGVGLYIQIKDSNNLFSKVTQRAAVCDALIRLSALRVVANLNKKEIPTGLCEDFRGHQVQLSLM